MTEALGQFLRSQRLESIGTLAGGIAHDLNNALAPIFMTVAILEDQIKDEDTLELLAGVTRSTQHCADLVRQVLTFARGAEGERVLLPIVEVLQEVKEMVCNTLPKSIRFRMHAGEDLWRITGDATQLHQLFTNLCVNARDAMPEGGELSVGLQNVVLDERSAKTQCGAKPGPYVLVTVADTGAGIPPAVQERIFEPFFTTKEIGKGTGLGLSSVLTIAKGHGATIDLWSELGKGTVFKVFLPATVECQQGEIALHLTPQPLARGNQELILLVDDEEAIRTSTQRALEGFGYRVLLASDGLEALSIYAGRSHEIDVVLTDLDMPGMDGHAAIAQLKALNPYVKIVCASGLTSNGGPARALEAGASHFIAKPYRVDRVLRVFEQLRQGTN